MTVEAQQAAAEAAKVAAAEATPVVTPEPEVKPEVKPEAKPSEGITPDVTPEPTKVEVSTDRQAQLKNFISDAGFDADALSTEFMKTGEVPLNVVAKLSEKHGEAVANMLVQQMQDQRTAQIATNDATDAKMFSHIENAFKGVTEQSGADTWAELSKWAGENMKDQKAEINAMLAQGGLQAQMAIDHMINTFKGSEDFTQPADLQSGEDRSNDNRIKVLTKTDYDSQLRELLKTKSYDSPEVQALGRRRSKAIARGQ